MIDQAFFFAEGGDPTLFTVSLLLTSGAFTFLVMMYLFGSTREEREGIRRAPQWRDLPLCLVGSAIVVMGQTLVLLFIMLALTDWWALGATAVLLLGIGLYGLGMRRQMVSR